MPTASSSADCTTTTACNLIQALLPPFPPLPLSPIGNNQLTGHHQLATIFTDTTYASTSPIPTLTPQVPPGFALLPAPATPAPFLRFPTEYSEVPVLRDTLDSPALIPRKYIQAARSRISLLLIGSCGLLTIFGFLLSFMYLLSIFFASGAVIDTG